MIIYRLIIQLNRLGTLISGVFVKRLISLSQFLLYGDSSHLKLAFSPLYPRITREGAV